MSINASLFERIAPRGNAPRSGRRLPGRDGCGIDRRNRADGIEIDAYAALVAVATVAETDGFTAASLCSRPRFGIVICE